MIMYDVLKVSFYYFTMSTSQVPTQAIYVLQKKTQINIIAHILDFPIYLNLVGTLPDRFNIGR